MTPLGNAISCNAKADATKADHFPNFICEDQERKQSSGLPAENKNTSGPQINAVRGIAQSCKLLSDVRDKPFASNQIMATKS